MNHTIGRSIELFFLKSLRSAYRMCSKNKPDCTAMSGDEFNDFIFKSLLSDSPIMIARYGSYELQAGLYNYILSLPIISRYMLFIKSRTSFIHKNPEYESQIMMPFCNNAGFFPNDTNLLPKYSKLMQDDTSILDCYGRFCGLEDILHPLFNKDIKFGELADMEPYDYPKPWSKALEGKRVLVIHPFAKSIEAQYSQKDCIWGDSDILPEFDLITIQAVQSIAGQKVPFSDWFVALDYMKSQMDLIDYDVAIIGCGAYGFHLAAHAKRTGHKAVHLGGATQILFGIKGKRWEDLPGISKFFNEYWIYPSDKETPQACYKVENGCYW